MEKVKVGIVGVGGIAQDRHIPLLMEHPQAEVTTLFDVRLDLAEQVAQTFNIAHVATSYDTLFDQVDAVVICTPNKFHSEIAIAALNAGVHVLCEKPMAISKKECDDMIEAAKKHHKILTVAYHYRFTDVAIEAKRRIDEGVVGSPVVSRIQALRHRKVPGWGVFTNKALQGGGCLIDYGCHVLDLVLWLLQITQPTEVSGRTYNKLSKQPHQINDWGEFDHETFNVEDHATSYIVFDNDATLQFECSWAANINSDKLDISISGEKGGLQLFPFEVYEPRNGEYLIHQQDITLNEDKAAERQTDNFIKSCLGIETPVVKMEEARRVSQIIEAIYESNEKKQTIQL
ncbi:Gfo/Idh/MocA family protein [Staphylococcus canis]|uniref:Gfo/Idh/MocA family oxidoreductase n=1 Tax=Staphylococcus canis TaxID=2724942 RepID=A0ABS0TAQ9_9STAP|nr:Gfo/Idh/MocA family oxidoreductase [Staphylococcus canis]MBI5974848.1 Gfo/Idh/MocA family oxidoreductase [Staphylococcus canis]